MQKVRDSLVNMCDTHADSVWGVGWGAEECCSDLFLALQGRLAPGSPPNGPENPPHPVHVTPPDTEYKKLEDGWNLIRANVAALRGWRCIEERDLMRSPETSVWRSWTSSKEHSPCSFFQIKLFLISYFSSILSVTSESTSCFLRATFLAEFLLRCFGFLWAEIKMLSFPASLWCFSHGSSAGLNRPLESWNGMRKC